MFTTHTHTHTAGGGLRDDTNTHWQWLSHTLQGGWGWAVWGSAPLNCTTLCCNLQCNLRTMQLWSFMHEQQSQVEETWAINTKSHVRLRPVTALQIKFFLNTVETSVCAVTHSHVTGHNAVLMCSTSWSVCNLFNSLPKRPAVGGAPNWAQQKYPKSNKQLKSFSLN